MNSRFVVPLLIVSVLVILSTYAGGVSPANAQSGPPPTGNITIRDGANAGEVIVAWDAVPEATHYRIGYVNMEVDYHFAKASCTGEWIEAFIYVDVNAQNIPVSRGRAEYTIRRLSQGARHAFTVLTSNDFVDSGVVGSVRSEFFWPSNPRWSFLTGRDSLPTGIQIPQPVCSAPVPQPQPVVPTCSPDDYDRDDWGSRPSVPANATATWTKPSDNVSAPDLTMDHHVALANAHVSGGCEWSSNEKHSFSSDTENLNPTTRSFGSSKADRTPDLLTGVAAAIIDTSTEKCDYATQHRNVKDKYALTMTDDERETVDQWLSLCTEMTSDGVKRFRDPDVNYFRWEIGPDVPQEQYEYLRTGIIGMHRYASDLNLPPLPGNATFYLYHDEELAARTLARLEDRSLADARARFADDGWLGLAGLDPGDEHSGWIMVNLQAYLRFPEAWRFTRTAAHELSHVYQYTLGKHGRFDTTHREVRVIGPAWIQEGVAVFHSERVLAMLGEVTYERSREKLISQSQRVDVSLKATETYDGLRAGPGRYDMAAMASELLAAEVGEAALISFWTLLGPDTPWQEAFETSFGMTIDEFYRVFEEHRSNGFPELGLPDLAPRIPLAETDRRALVALYESAGGSNWTQDGNWLSNEPGNLWHGVTTDRNGRVTALDLSDNRLRGHLPAELGDLRNLRELRLENNLLNGAIPPELGNLTKLTMLSLFRNELSGPIPEELGDLTDLTELRIWGNRLSGEIPPALASLNQLTAFSVGVNQLTGEIPPWLGSFRDLRSLHLSTNQLTGTIPDNLANLKEMRYFNVNRNQLTGEIPSWLAAFPLKQLYLNDNGFTGEIPAEFSNLMELESLWLGGNLLAGCVPPGLRAVPDNDLDRLTLPDC